MPCLCFSGGTWKCPQEAAQRIIYQNYTKLSVRLCENTIKGTYVGKRLRTIRKKHKTRRKHPKHCEPLHKFTERYTTTYRTATKPTPTVHNLTDPLFGQIRYPSAQQWHCRSAVQLRQIRLHIPQQHQQYLPACYIPYATFSCQLHVPSLCCVGAYLLSPHHANHPHDW